MNPLSKANIIAAIESKLITKKESKRFPGYFVLKYTPKCNWDKIWNPTAIQCRGTVIDKDYNIIVLPIQKCFYDGEIFPSTLDDDSRVRAYKKVNGFMAALTYVPKLERFVVTTTGSMDSDYVSIAERYLRNDRLIRMEKSYSTGMGAYWGKRETYLFEICAPEDPHIIKEDIGMTYLGCREFISGNIESFNPPDAHTISAVEWILGRVNFVEPIVASYGEIKESLKNVRHEGFMVFDSHGNITKLKSHYYNDKKTIARAKPEKLNSLFNFTKKLENPEVQQFLVANIDKFRELDERGRIALLESNDYLFGE